MECVSYLDDVVVATRGGRIYAYLDDPAVGEQVMREKPVVTTHKILKHLNKPKYKQH
ncbi:MAG: hypothetical protein QW290_03325 [Sulfolobales archaeon]